MGLGKYSIGEGTDAMVWPTSIKTIMSVSDVQAVPKTTSTTRTIDLKSFTFNDMRLLVSDWMKVGSSSHTRSWWDMITCLRGPDSPSERPDMSAQEASVAYSARRERKYKTVEVIRNKAFFGVIGGAARSHKGDSVTLPPRNQWDHFDKHVERAAKALGLKVIIEGEK